MDPENTAARCKNCNAVLLGRYCVNCSQPADVHVPSTTEFIHEALEGLTHSDSRLWRTLLLLWFKPGQLTLEFIAGKRVAYMPPFRLYLVVSVIFFLIASFIRMHGPIIKFDDSPSRDRPSVMSCDDMNISITGHPELSNRLQHVCKEAMRDNGASWLHIAISVIPKAMFIFLPLIAFLHMLMYWHPRHRYAEHLLFFLHLHACFFSAAILLLLSIDAAQAWPVLNRGTDILSSLLGWAMALYTYIAIRRVFGRSWIGTFFKGLVLFVVYFTVLGFGAAGVFLYAALQL
jgi:Protein of unknown function (DUF3667)